MIGRPVHRWRGNGHWKRAAAALLQGKSQERIEQRRLRRGEDVERQQRRERAASVLAEVSALLQEVRTQQSFVERSPAESQRQRAEQLLERLDPLHAEEQAASEQLILMAIREPNPEVRQLARQLVQAMNNGVYQTSMPGCPCGPDHQVPGAELHPSPVA